MTSNLDFQVAAGGEISKLERVDGDLPERLSCWARSSVVFSGISCLQTAAHEAAVRRSAAECVPVQNVRWPPMRSSRPITIADGRPSDDPIVVTALVTALLLNTL